MEWGGGLEKTTSRKVLDVTLVPDKGGMATLLKKKKSSGFLEGV